jgi:hypothetical protein
VRHPIRSRKQSEDLQKQYAKHRKELLEHLERHDGKAADVDRVFNQLQAKTLKETLEVVDRRFALKDKLTRDEWQRVFQR